MPRKELKKTEKPKYRRYSSNHKALMVAEVEALKSNGMSQNKALAEVSARNGMSTRRIYEMLQGESDPILKPGEANHIKKALTSKSYATSYWAQDNVTQDKLDKASFVQLMVGSKIALEMGRLLEDRSTANISHRGFIETMQADREKIVEQLRLHGVDLDGGEENAP